MSELARFIGQWPGISSFTLYGLLLASNLLVYLVCRKDPGLLWPREQFARLLAIVAIWSRLISSIQPSPVPGNIFPRTANIFPVTPPANPSTCLAYCSTCLLLSNVSNLPGSCGNLKSLCHSSSGSGLCFASALLAFSDFLFCCQVVILACSRASCL